MTLREAAQQALEDICAAKLCEFNSMSSRHEMTRLMDKAITTLRIALAEPERRISYVCPQCHWTLDTRRTEPEQEPVELMGAPLLLNGQPLYTHPPQRTEPNADYERGFVDGRQHQAKSSVDKAVNAMARKPLTDEQISDLWCETSNTDFVTADTHVFARAIEKAHGIGGGDE